MHHFHGVDKKSVPFPLFREKFKSFGHEDAQDARAAFLDSAGGVASAGDLNDDGTDELLMVPDNRVCGSGDCRFYRLGEVRGLWEPWPARTGPSVLSERIRYFATHSEGLPRSTHSR